MMDTDIDLAEYEDDVLLRAFASLTHVLHSLRERDESHGDVHGPRIRAAREQRDELQAEILRRMRRPTFEESKPRIEASIHLGIGAEEDWDGPSIKPGTLTDDQLSWLASWLAGDGVVKP